MSDSQRRRNPKLRMSFDFLEGRALMNAGVVHAPQAQPQVAVVQAHAQPVPGPSRGPIAGHVAPAAGVVHALRATTVRPVTGSFKGTIQLTSSGLLALGGLTGKLGKAPLTGHGLGEAAGNRFEGGVVVLSGSEGTLTISLGPATLKNAPKGGGTFNSTMIIEGATGNYAGDNDAVVGSAGNFQVNVSNMDALLAGTLLTVIAEVDIDSLDSLGYLILSAYPLANPR
jgi:hypothetical protein